MTERSGALQEDMLYMSYAQIIAKSCGEEEEEGGDEEDPEVWSIVFFQQDKWTYKLNLKFKAEEEGGASIHVSFFLIV